MGTERDWRQRVKDARAALERAALDYAEIASAPPANGGLGDAEAELRLAAMALSKALLTR